jgi:hypothetical protein
MAMMETINYGKKNGCTDNENLFLLNAIMSIFD